MANPSLQIGNDNWAIKEDNLLGYSTAGTRFVPQPITMTRATLGTRVNPSGLVETVDLVVGSEFIDNTNFATDTDWGGSYTINTVTQQLTKTSSGLAYQIDGGIIAGKSYKIVVDVASLDGATTVWVAGNNYNLSLGIQTIYATGGTNSWNGGRIAINNGYASGTGSVLNSISAKEATIDNLPRVDYTDGTSSLLAEPERRNLIPYSEDFTSWLAQDYVTVTEDTSETTSPSGNNTASKITINSVSTVRRLYEVISTSSGSDYTFTVYAKKGTTDYIRFFLNSNIFDVTFDLTNGTKTVTTGSGSIESIGNDWYRLEATGTSSLTTEVPQIQLSNSASVNDYLYIWGSQFEEGSYATSYIPNFGTVLGVTRNADQYTKTGISDKINSEEGVLFVEMAALSDDNTDRRLSLNDGSANNEIRIGYSRFTGNIISEVASGGITQNINWGATGVTQTNNNKFALSWGGGTLKFYVNGSQTNIETGITSPVGLNTLKFSRGDNALPFYGKVRQLQVYKTALTGSELATLTTI